MSYPPDASAYPHPHQEGIPGLLLRCPLCTYACVEDTLALIEKGDKRPQRDERSTIQTSTRSPSPRIRSRASIPLRSWFASRPLCPLPRRRACVNRPAKTRQASRLDSVRTTRGGRARAHALRLSFAESVPRDALRGVCAVALAVRSSSIELILGDVLAQTPGPLRAMMRLLVGLVWAAAVVRLRRSPNPRFSRFSRLFIAHLVLLSPLSFPKFKHTPSVPISSSHITICPFVSLVSSASLYSVFSCRDYQSHVPPTQSVVCFPIAEGEATVARRHPFCYLEHSSQFLRFVVERRGFSLAPCCMALFTWALITYPQTCRLHPNRKGYRLLAVIRDSNLLFNGVFLDTLPLGPFKPYTPHLASLPTMSLDRIPNFQSSGTASTNVFQRWSSPKISMKQDPVKWTQEWERFLEIPRPPRFALA
ncbi:hypothetical protein C8R44DRAFT_215 [Mycena epipterygia]|nr:hypothetical protein C8R44DRAFT_215 [Mycena epipterygia]